MSNRHRAFAARSECELRRIVERAAVRAGADRNICDHFAAFRVEHHHHLVVTGREQTMMRRVERNAGRFFPRRERPIRDHFMLRAVDHRDCAFIFDVHVDAPGIFIGHCEFRISGKRNCRDNFCISRSDHSHGIAGVIENVKLFAFRFVNDRVRVLSGVDLRNGFQRRKIDNARFVFFPVG